MSTSSRAATNFVGFLNTLGANGPTDAFASLDLSDLSGQPFENAYISIADAVCTNTGTVDEAIARDAFIETLGEFQESGVTDFEQLAAEHVTDFLGSFIAHSIVGRLYNDVALNGIHYAPSPDAARRIEEQLKDFVRRATSDAVGATGAAFQKMSNTDLRSTVDGIYHRAYEILITMADRYATA